MISNIHPRAWPVVLFCATALLMFNSAFSQIPDQFTNLQVLPKDISKNALVQQMRGFAIALGVRCQHCHIGEEGKPLNTFDFVSDVKPAKQTARLMLRMVEVINTEHLAKIANRAADAEPVTCVTCHHGQNRPRQLEEMLYEVIAAQGVQAGLAHYRELREKYYGGFVFDFRELVLIGLAQQLQSESKFEDAIAVLNLNTEFFPHSAATFYVLGETYLKKGNKALALENFKKTLEIEPNNQAAQRQLDELTR